MTPSGPRTAALIIKREKETLSMTSTYLRSCRSAVLGVLLFGLVLGSVGSANAALPDNRVYEPVSPVTTEGSSAAYMQFPGSDVLTLNSEHGVRTHRPFEVAPDGRSIVWQGDPPPEGGGGKEGESNGSTYLATRSPSGGWSAVNLQPPGEQAASYLAFTPSLAEGILELGVGMYSYATGQGESGVLEQLAGSVPVPVAHGEHVSFYFAGGNSGAPGAPEFEHRLFESSQDLLTGAGAFETELREAVASERFPSLLYDSVAGHVSVVDVLPSGAPAAHASFGAFSSGSRLIASGVLTPDFDNVISSDGSRVIWTAGETVLGAEEKLVDQPKALYLRENPGQPESPLGENGQCVVPADACTVQIDASTKPGTPAEKEEQGGTGVFLDATRDGSKIYFTDEKRLTADSTAAAGEPDLYEYEPASRVGEPGVLSDLTVSGGSAPADVKGLVGLSDDGAYLYFVAGGVLASNVNERGEAATSESCQEAEFREEGLGRIPAGAGCNLYMLHEGRTTFIAKLPAGDDGGREGTALGSGVEPFDSATEPHDSGDWQVASGFRTAEVTPDGHSLIFMSKRPLTGYDSTVTFSIARGGSFTIALDEVFLFDAATGRLRCVSCNPGGAPPIDTPGLGSFSQPLGGFFPISQTPNGNVHAFRPERRVISADGNRIFFDSGEPLVAQHTSGWLGVYEWERDGTGSCHATEGCIYLLSSGSDPENSYLIGADEIGENVFFVTTAQLVSQDKNDQDDLYDAHVGGAAPPAAPACEGSGCQGVPPPPPSFATPASLTFAGAGNFVSQVPVGSTKPKATSRARLLAKALKACNGYKRKAKRVSCKKRARERYGAAASKHHAAHPSAPRRKA